MIYRQTRTMMLLVFVLVASNQGCNQGSYVLKKISGTISFHENYGWVAEDYFDDAQVIALCRAIEANNVQEMERLIKNGANVNALGKGNMTPLMWAYPDNKLERFQTLLKHGANPNVKITSNFGIKWGFLPGECVTTRVGCLGSLEHFKSVMQNGGDPNASNGLKMPLVHSIILAMIPDAKERCEIALSQGADINAADNVANTSNYRTTPAMASLSGGGQYHLTLFFLENGADPTVYREDRLQKLIHFVVARENKLHQMQPGQRVMFKRVLDWLIAHGEDADAARVDLKRWKEFSFIPAEYGRQWQAEVDAKEKREQEEATRGGVPSEKKADQLRDKHAPTDPDNSAAD